MDGGQSKPYCGQYTSSSVKNQIVKEVIMQDYDEPLVKGGCGHSDREVGQSAMICGVCFGLMLLLLIGIGIAEILT